MAVQCVMIVRRSDTTFPVTAGVIERPDCCGLAVGAQLDLDQKRGQWIGDLKETLRQPVRGKSDAFSDLEQTVFHASRLRPKRLDDGRFVELQRQVEPGHHRHEGKLLAREIAAQASGLQHVVQLFGELRDLRIVGRVRAGGGADIGDADPHLTQELFKRGDELRVRGLGLDVRVRLAVVGAVIEVHAEHALIRVPPIGAQVGPDVAGHVGDHERRRVAVEQLFGVAEPVLGVCIQRGAELLAVTILVQDPAKDLVHPGVLDHVGVDQVVPTKHTAADGHTVLAGWSQTGSQSPAAAVWRLRSGSSLKWFG